MEGGKIRHLTFLFHTGKKGGEKRGTPAPTLPRRGGGKGKVSRELSLLHSLLMTEEKEGKRRGGEGPTTTTPYVKRKGRKEVEKRREKLHSRAHPLLISH